MLKNLHGIARPGSKIYLNYSCVLSGEGDHAEEQEADTLQR